MNTSSDCAHAFPTGLWCWVFALTSAVCQFLALVSMTAGSALATVPTTTFLAVFARDLLLSTSSCLPTNSSKKTRFLLVKSTVGLMLENRRPNIRSRKLLRGLGNSIHFFLCEVSSQNGVEYNDVHQAFSFQYSSK